MRSFEGRFGQFQASSPLRSGRSASTRHLVWSSFEQALPWNTKRPSQFLEIALISSDVGTEVYAAGDEVVGEIDQLLL
jgi:hypothetical protein